MGLNCSELPYKNSVEDKDLLASTPKKGLVLLVIDHIAGNHCRSSAEAGTVQPQR